MKHHFSCIPFYDILTEQEQICFIENCSVVDFDCREAVFKQGSFAVNIYIILEGYCKLTFQTNEKKRIVFIPHKGEMIGKDYMVKTHYPYSVHTLTKTKLMIIPKTFLNDICLRNPDFYVKLTQMSESNMLKTMEWMINLGFKNIEGAVAMFLMKFCNTEYRNIDLSRTEIAEVIGYSRESVIHTLKKFVSENLISTKGKEIHVIDREKLEEIIKYS
ncbi:Crp/Fnr family transcriptional regulator [Apibacter raozihei]|uniref:Crp/Fnr family transcriptional regulator n=1 Tax=Apibacter TaxID=1778601 RepID=UPI000FE2F794|nr:MULTISPECIES: Crp/Fnr family transcriptional regulator [Apibacter]